MSSATTAEERLKQIWYLHVLLFGTVGILVSNYLIEEPAVLSIRALFLLKNPLLLCLIRIPNPYFPPF